MKFQISIPLIVSALIVSCSMWPGSKKNAETLRNPDQVKLLYPQGQSVDVAMEEGLLGPIHPNGLTGPEGYLGTGFIDNVGDSARMEIFFPKKSNGQAVIVCPGGGYTALNALVTGLAAGNWLSSQGFTAVILKYRMPNGDIALPMRDVTNAILYSRKMADKWKISQVGIIGGSAGGHLAAYAAAHPESEASRPDFAVLLYPLTSIMDPSCFGYTSILAATTPAEQALHDLSLELNVGENLPPVMIAANKKDPIIPLHQFPDYYNALSAKGFDVELHMYETGSHGWGFMTKEYAEALCRDNSNVWGLKDPPGTPYGDDMGKSREIFNNDFLSFTNRVKK